MKAFRRCAWLLFALLVCQLAWASDFTVDTLVDETDGSCSDGDCSLRDAIDLATDGDQIEIPAGTYLLTGGALEIEKDIALIGSGAQQTILDANLTSSVVVTSLESKIPSVRIEKLTIARGKTSAFGRGGGVFAVGNVILRDCIVRDSEGYNGGGVVSDFGSLLIERCTIRDNTVAGNSAGGILVGSAQSFTLVDSTVTGNTAPAAERVGGGIAFFNADNTVVSMRNSTIVGNSAADSGGGIYVSPFTSANAVVNISNSVIANNGAAGDCSGPITSLGHNLDSDGTCSLSASGDVSSTDPDLGALALNNGSTESFLPNPTSPLIDAGNPAPLNSTDAACTFLDQRQKLRAGNNRCDIGAVEVNGPTPQTIGGTVEGLIGSGLILQNNGSDDLTITANGAFTFDTPLGTGDAYAVTVAAQPGESAEQCTVSQGSGTVGSAAVTDVLVQCRVMPILPVPVLGFWGLGGLILMMILLATQTRLSPSRERLSPR